jgi:hypothetical protein
VSKACENGAPAFDFERESGLRRAAADLDREPRLVGGQIVEVQRLRPSALRAHHQAHPCQPSHSLHESPSFSPTFEPAPCRLGPLAERPHDRLAPSTVSGDLEKIVARVASTTESPRARVGGSEQRALSFRHALVR